MASVVHVGCGWCGRTDLRGLFSSVRMEHLLPAHHHQGRGAAQTVFNPPARWCPNGGWEGALLCECGCGEFRSEDCQCCQCVLSEVEAVLEDRLQPYEEN